MSVEDDIGLATRAISTPLALSAERAKDLVAATLAAGVLSGRGAAGVPVGEELALELFTALRAKLYR